MHLAADTSPIPNVTLNESSKHDKELMGAAKALESTFLAEMLKSAGLGETPTYFGGGEGEGQFTSLLSQAQAEQMVEAGGIGLAQQLFETLKDNT